MDYLPGIFALLVAAAGGYYLFYSTAAQRLKGIENEQRNRLRIRLRRAGGVMILLLAVAFYAMFVALRRQRLAAAGMLLLVVMGLMGAIVVLGLIDLRLTQHLRRDRRDEGRP
jgi:UDP-N-acetylmuramyl pentapeptide phosphotransferase/UDP-N-acetylglucosamine-1-phosphate transferase